ncbi:choice-of-anchor A family protein [Sphingopyxis sp. JAI128]|uniref:choice-of-anchor A family protein n=1 Tax=Sphingopyxis sp. JAI128 TaxID=2723066 RepID=UPI0021A9F12B|nr:choice-of-anchor A family protein [Sphingopyxis sp. JAI128]
MTPALAQQAGSVTGIDALREWNLVVLGNLQSSSEVEGRTFVGGNLTGNSSNYGIRATSSPNGQPGLTVVGNITGGHKNLNNGSGAVVGGNVTSGFNLNGPNQIVKVGGTISNTNVNQNKVLSNLDRSDPTFGLGLQQQKADLKSSMGSLSFEMATLAANSPLTVQAGRGIFNAQPNGQGLAVFDISAADLDRIGEIQFNLNGADTAIVNVGGRSVRLDDNFLGGTNNLGEHVIWNFPDAEELTLSTAWGGSVLAPLADAETRNYIQGSAVFGNLKQDGEMHIGTFKGGYVTPPSGGTSTGGDSSTGGGTSSGGGGTSSGGAVPVPEPGMFGLFGLGVAGLILWRRRRAERDAR